MRWSFESSTGAEPPPPSLSTMARPMGFDCLKPTGEAEDTSLRVQVTDDGTRHVIVTEIARSPGGAEVVVRTANYIGPDAAALAAALAADDSLVQVSEGGDLTALPTVVAGGEFARRHAARHEPRAGRWPSRVAIS